MKNLIFYFFAFMLVSVIACGGEEEALCSQEDWVGTYTLTEDPECDDEQFIWLTTLEIAAGSTTTSVIVDGGEVPFKNCDITGSLTGNISNDNGTLTVFAAGCEGVYR